MFYRGQSYDYYLVLSTARYKPDPASLPQATRTRPAAAASLVLLASPRRRPSGRLEARPREKGGGGAAPSSAGLGVTRCGRRDVILLWRGRGRSGPPAAGSAVPGNGSVAPLAGSGPWRWVRWEAVVRGAAARRPAAGTSQCPGGAACASACRSAAAAAGDCCCSRLLACWPAFTALRLRWLGAASGACVDCPRAAGARSVRDSCVACATNGRRRQGGPHDGTTAHAD